MIVLILFGLAALNCNTISRRRKEFQEYGTPLMNSAHKGMIIGLSIADLITVGLFVFILCVLSVGWLPRVCIILIGIAVVLLPIVLMLRWWDWKPWVLLVFCAVTGVCGLAYHVLHQDYLNRITLPDYFDYTDYTPFMEGSLVRTLDEPATLQFTDGDDLPRMDGATALYPVYAAIAQATYPESLAQKEIGEVLDIVDCTTTPVAYERIVNGDCDMIFVAGPSEKQDAYAKEKGVELVYTPIGQEAFVFFVHPDNPINGMTLEEIRGIYSGQITEWDQLGVKKLGKILAYQRDEGSGSQTALERFVMKDTPLMEPDKETVEDGMGGIIEQVSAYKNHRNAIGFSFRFYCTALMKNFDVKLLSIDGVEPTVENIENGKYPLASSFYVVTRSDADENTRALVEWICSEQGQALVEKTGYTKLPPE